MYSKDMVAHRVRSGNCIAAGTCYQRGLHRGIYIDSEKLDMWRVLLLLLPCAGFCL